MGNMLLFLIVGPLLEIKYGWKNFLIMILITALVTGIINFIIGKVSLCGFSGVVFMCIILSSFVNLKTGMIPLTFILVSIFYIGNEIIQGVIKKDDVSHFTHIIGAICGCIYGLYFI